MPDDKDQIPKPDERPEEKKYSFLQETIKPKPISRQQLVKQLVRIAIYGVILGAFACLGFFALKPWMQDVFRGNLETVSIPEDEDLSETRTFQETESFRETRMPHRKKKQFRKLLQTQRVTSRSWTP